MPTIAPEPPPVPHRIRDVAEGFGTEADRYDRTRPRYPEAAIGRILDSCPGTEVLDVGCGTGISARAFQGAGAHVLGVEPDERMAAFARDRGLVVEVARFEDWDPGDRTFDAVVAGQTWHWVDPVAGAANAAAVLRPAGRFAAFWNVAQPPEEVGAAFGEVYRRLLPELPVAAAAAAPAMALYEPMADTAADGIRAAGLFGEPERWRFEWRQHYPRDAWLDQVPTHGGMARLPAPRRAELLAGLGEAIGDAGFTMSYTTLVVTAALG